MSAPGFWDCLLLVVCVGSAAFNTVFAVSATRRLKRLRRVLAWRQRRLEKLARREMDSAADLQIGSDGERAR